jgi:hypothetical protein
MCDLSCAKGPSAGRQSSPHGMQPYIDMLRKVTGLSEERCSAQEYFNQCALACFSQLHQNGCLVSVMLKPALASPECDDMLKARSCQAPKLCN